MKDIRNPQRSPALRMVAIAASGTGSFAIGLLGIQLGLGKGILGLPAEIMLATIAGLVAVTATLAVLSFFAGVDESAAYVRHETQIDKLTGLHTRAAMVERIAQAAARTLTTGQPVFLVDIDIDRFKQINDSIGYSQGDQLIRAFARRLRKRVPEDIEIGRIGAGEFALLISDERLRLPLQEAVQNLIDELMQPYQLPSHVQIISLSVGIAAMPKDGEDPAVLLRHSNLALQHARASGIGAWATFERHMSRSADQRRWIEAELHVALERGDFEVHYQPQFDLLRRRLIAFEALVRWYHPQRGLISPAEFIQVAEETGMIGPIGEWVLRRACEDARLMPEGCMVAVNISPVQFMTRDFLAMVRQVVETTGIDPARLELEVTETAMMQDRHRATLILEELSEMGISVAVDDFGTGYSNLNYLADFRFRKLKIDQSFVRRMETAASSGAIVATIVGLSRALGVQTIAEGVETEHQATLLCAAGCEAAQGYLYGAALPLERALALFAEEPDAESAPTHAPIGA